MLSQYTSENREYHVFLHITIDGPFLSSDVPIRWRIAIPSNPIKGRAQAVASSTSKARIIYDCSSAVPQHTAGRDMQGEWRSNARNLAPHSRKVICFLSLVVDPITVIAA